MKCLTPDECSRWLSERGLVENPYDQQTVPAGFYFQFRPPRQAGRLTEFTRDLFDGFPQFSEALVVFTDWPFYFPDEMALVESLRRGHREHRILLDAPVHFFDQSEKAEAIAHCYLPLLFGWTAYLYLPSATFLFWEGDLMDFWSADEFAIDAMCRVVQSYELAMTSKKEA